MKSNSQSKLSQFFSKTRKAGFTLVEVILGSVIIAGFVGTTVYTAGEIAIARRESLAVRDTNSWANLQTNLAAQGIAAPSNSANGNSDIWSNGNFGELRAATSTNSLGVASTSTNQTGSDLGKSLVVRPFLLSHVGVAQRSNVNTLGLALIDKSTYNSIAAGSNPANLTKPDSLLGLSTNLAIKTGATASISTGSSVTLTALTDVDWTNTDGVAFYVLLDAKTGAISSASCTINDSVFLSGASASITSGTTTYDYAIPVRISNLTSLTSTTLTIKTTATDSNGLTSSGVITVNVTPIKPVIVMDRVSSTSTSTIVSTSNLTIADVTGYPLNGSSSYNLLRVRAFALYTSESSYTAIPTNALSYIGLNDYIGTSAVSFKSVTSISRSTTGNTISAQLALSDINTLGSATPSWTAATTSGCYALISNSSNSKTLTISKSTLPTPSIAGGTYSASPLIFTITETSSSALISTTVDATISTVKYVYNLSSTIPSSMTSYTGGSGSTTYGGSVLIAATTNVSVLAQAVPIAAYTLFLNSSNTGSGSFTYSDTGKEAKTVMKINYINSTLDGYVQGSIQVLFGYNPNLTTQSITYHDFTLNGSYSMGLNLYVYGHPKVHYKVKTVATGVADEPGAYSSALCTVVGVSYTAGTFGTGIGSDQSDSNLKFKSGYSTSGYEATVSSIPSGYKLPLITDSKTTVAMVAPTSYITTKSSNTYDVTIKTATGTTWTDSSSKSNSTSVPYTWLDTAADKTYFTSTNYNNNQNLRPTGILMNAGTHHCTLTIESGETLYLNAGTHYFYSLKIQTGGKIVFKAAGVNIVAGNLELGDNVEMNPGASATLDFATLKLGNSSKIIPTGAGVKIRTSSSNGGSFGSNSVVPTVTNIVVSSDATSATFTATGGIVVGTSTYPVEIHLTSTTNSSDVLYGQIYGTVYSNGFIQINGLVKGKVECNAIQINSTAYLFIKNL